jgi:organic hydroperoxide reductase OsmC/OhrA
MHPYPHVYRASASAGMDEAVKLAGAGLPSIDSMPPVEFDGPGDRWSPESLLIAAVSDCLVLTFRAIARASGMHWLKLDCETEGVLNRVDGVTRFTHFNIRAKLTAPAGTDEHKAMRMLEKSEAACLVSNSLNGEKHLHASVEILP